MQLQHWLHNLSLPLNLSLADLPDLPNLPNPLQPSTNPQDWLVSGATLGFTAALLQMLASVGAEAVQVGEQGGVLGA